MRIRRLIPLLLFILPFLSPSVTHAANDGSPDPVALRLAIEDLIETFDDEYPDGESYLAELDALESEPDARTSTRSSSRSSAALCSRTRSLRTAASLRSSRLEPDGDAH